MHEQGSWMELAMPPAVIKRLRALRKCRRFAPTLTDHLLRYIRVHLYGCFPLQPCPANSVPEPACPTHDTRVRFKLRRVLPLDAASYEQVCVLQGRANRHVGPICCWFGCATA